MSQRGLAGDAGSPNFYEPGGDEYDTWSTIDFTNIGSTLEDNLSQ